MTNAQVAGGHKANLNNSTSSQDSKEHSKRVLENDYNGGDGERDSIQASWGVPAVLTGGNDFKATGSDGQDEHKNPKNVAGGLKAAIKNPNVSDEAKENAKQRLDNM